MIVKLIFFTLSTHPFLGQEVCLWSDCVVFPFFAFHISLNKPLIVPNLKKRGCSQSLYYYNNKDGLKHDSVKIDRIKPPWKAITSLQFAEFIIVNEY